MKRCITISGEATTVGIDLGDKEHVVCILDAEGRKAGSMRIGATAGAWRSARGGGENARKRAGAAAKQGA